jgi:DNA-binding NarL/FixJ family response regulator
MHLRNPRIIVADDNPPFLQRVTSSLAGEFDVVAIAMSGESALKLIRHYAPDVVVVNLKMSALSGSEIIRALAATPSKPSVVICSGETDPAFVEAAQQAGALAYVFRAQIETDLILAVRSVVQGKPFVSQAAAPKLPGNSLW